MKTFEHPKAYFIIGNKYPMFTSRGGHKAGEVFTLVGIRPCTRMQSGDVYGCDYNPSLKCPGMMRFKEEPFDDFYCFGAGFSHAFIEEGMG